jgi:hypothetical protein
MYLPLLHPPPKGPSQHIESMTSHAHSNEPLKRIKSLSQEPKPSKGKQLSNTSKSNQSEASSH